jgi:PIN domain nuclease of toxin-antitoxin system
VQLLLDTHAFLWWLAGDAALSTKARKAIADQRNAVYVSAASAWEIATRHRLGKLPGVAAIVHNLKGALNDQNFSSLPIDIEHAQVAGALPGPLRDPFDRMLIAQATLENLLLVSNEQAFESYAVRRLW